MLTDKQKEWINHLNDADRIKIIPFNPKVKEYFEEQKREIQKILGEDIEVELHGASGFEISGQGDVDIYIPVPPDQFDNLLEKFKQHYGAPGSLYPGERARFNRYCRDTKVEVFIINKDSEGWASSLAFESYLKSHPEALEAYRKLKEKANGVSTKEYYRRKIEFINSILEKIT